MREQAVGVSGVLGAILWLPRLGDFTRYGSVARSYRLPALLQNSQGGQLSLTGGRKQQLDGFSSNC